MAVANLVYFRHLGRNYRLDAEYYKPQYYRILKRLGALNAQPIRQYFQPATEMFVPVPGKKFRYIEIARVSTKYGSVQPVEIDGRNAPSRARYIVHTNDVIVSLVRPERNAVAYIDQDLNGSVCSSGFLVLRAKSRVSPFYLFAYLKARPVVDLLARHVTATMYPAITADDVLSLPIFIPKAQVYNAIVSDVQRAFALINESKIRYAEAEQILIQALGLEGLNLPTQTTHTAMFSETVAAERLDAEFFRPQYHYIIEYLSSKFKIERIGDWGPVYQGRSVQYTDAPNGIPVIRAGDLADLDDVSDLKRALPDRSLFILKKGDVCISSIGFGSIGKVAVFDKNGTYATVSEVTVIRQNRVNPYYLQVYLQSIAGQLQIERWITGATGQLHLYPRHVAQFIVPLLSPDLQNEFENLIMKARSLKHESIRLLGQARQRIEQAILLETS